MPSRPTQLTVPELVESLLADQPDVERLQAELRHYSGMERLLQAPAAAGDASAITDLGRCREFVWRLQSAIELAEGKAPG